MILEKLVSNKGLLVANLLCLAIGIKTILSLSDKTYGLAFGLALVVMGAVYLGYKVTAWRWLETVYLPVGVLAIFIGVLAFIDWIHRLLALLAFLKT